MEILPAILAADEIDFRKRIFHDGLRKSAKTFHVDILDGSLFGATCWADPNVIGTWHDLPDIELHCMVQNPLPIVEAWHERVHTVRRVIVHYECGRPLRKLIPAIHNHNVDVMLAVNPHTPVDVAAGLPLDGLLIMGVEPGASGQTFLGEPILSKVRRAKSLFPNLPIAVDGGVSETNIVDLWKAGVQRCAASSALWKAENPEENYQNIVRLTS